MNKVGQILEGKSHLLGRKRGNKSALPRAAEKNPCSAKIGPLVAKSNCWKRRKRRTTTRIKEKKNLIFILV